MNERLSRSEQSRINGSRSQGPKTAEGKLRSSMNHFIHGRRSQYFTVLTEEDHAAFRALRADLVRDLRPSTATERRLVHELTSVEWRLQRLAMMETALLDHECRAERIAFATEEPHLDPGVVVSTATHHLIEHSKLPAYLGTHTAQLIYQREAILRHLRTLRHTTPIPAHPTSAIPSTPPNPTGRAPRQPHPKPAAPAAPVATRPGDPPADQ